MITYFRRRALLTKLAGRVAKVPLGSVPNWLKMERLLRVETVDPYSRIPMAHYQLSKGLDPLPWGLRPQHGLGHFEAPHIPRRVPKGSSLEYPDTKMRDDLKKLEAKQLKAENMADQENLTKALEGLHAAQRKTSQDFRNFKFDPPPPSNPKLTAAEKSVAGLAALVGTGVLARSLMKSRKAKRPKPTKRNRKKLIAGTTGAGAAGLLAYLGLREGQN